MHGNLDIDLSGGDPDAIGKRLMPLYTYAVKTDDVATGIGITQGHVVWYWDEINAIDWDIFGFDRSGLHGNSPMAVDYIDGAGTGVISGTYEWSSASELWLHIETNSYGQVTDAYVNSAKDADAQQEYYDPSATDGIFAWKLADYLGGDNNDQFNRIWEGGNWFFSAVDLQGGEAGGTML